MTPEGSCTSTHPLRRRRLRQHVPWRPGAPERRERQGEFRSLVDRQSAEAFGGSGEAAITDHIFPGAPAGERRSAPRTTR
ncbi:GH32 C-terminal domain-containing protein [Streptomyces sp. NPDC006259]|uniref:GH32 C-terminal domain-containing protein n=1 Tax=Streptomyces sp. NPDC006259 TaxID=3364740 RepID=UPI0036AEAB5A